MADWNSPEDIRDELLRGFDPASPVRNLRLERWNRWLASHDAGIAECASKQAALRGIPSAGDEANPDMITTVAGLDAQPANTLIGWFGNAEEPDGVAAWVRLASGGWGGLGCVNPESSSEIISAYGSVEVIRRGLNPAGRRPEANSWR